MIWECLEGEQHIGEKNISKKMYRRKNLEEKREKILKRNEISKKKPLEEKINLGQKVSRKNCLEEKC